MGLLEKVFGKKIDGENDQSKDEIDLVSFVKGQVDSSRQSGSRVANESLWLTNIAYLIGYSGVFFDSVTRQFRTANSGDRPFRRNKIRINTVLPTSQNRLARLCKNRPKYDVLPNSNDSDDKEAARLGLDVLNDVWDKQDIDKKRIRLMQGVQQAGHWYFKISWDDQLGEMIKDPVSDDFIYEGDISAEVVSAFEVYADPLAKTLEEAQWVAQCKVRKLDYFRTHYEKGNLVKEEGPWLLSAQYELRIQSMNPYGQAQSAPQNQMKNAAIEICYYEKRSKKHPNGRMIVVANGILLEDKDLPVGEIPIVKFDDIVIEGKYFSESTITHIRPIQDQQNRIIQMRSSWLNQLLAGKYIAAKGHGIMQESFNDQSGEIVEYNAVPGAPPPQPLQAPTIPSYAYQEEDRLKEWNSEISGIGQISKSQLPAAGIPAVGMQFLQEQDETRLGIVTDYNEYNWARVGGLILEYAERFYTNPRLLRIAGTGGEYKVRQFVGEDLRGHTKVKVVKGSTIPGSKVLKRQEIINLYTMGLLGPAQDPMVAEKVLGLLEYGDIQGAWDKLGADTLQINKQIKEMEQGMIPLVSELDNNELHLQKKNLYRISEKFEQLPTEIQSIFLSDIEQRIEILANRANPELKARRQQLQQQMQSIPEQEQEALDMAEVSGNEQMMSQMQ